MGRQIIQQPDGNYSIFSSVVDDWIVTDATKEEVQDFFAVEAMEKAIHDVDLIFHKMEKGQNVYHQFGMTYEEAVEQIKAVHEPQPCGCGFDTCAECFPWE